MCRNITTLRGLVPDATTEEIEAAARQYVRKVSGVQSTSGQTVEPFERAVALVAEATTQLLDSLPARREPPKVEPPLRRRAAAAAAAVAAGGGTGSSQPAESRPDRPRTSRQESRLAR